MKVHFFATSAVGEKTQIWNLLELLNQWLEKHNNIDVKNIQQSVTQSGDTIYIFISVWYDERNMST